MASRNTVAKVLASVQGRCMCPAHSQAFNGARYHRCTSSSSGDHGLKPKEYAVEMSSSSVIYGPGVTREVGHQMLRLRASKELQEPPNIGLFTDGKLVSMEMVRTALDSLESTCGKVHLFSDVRIEPNTESMQAAVDFARDHNLNGYVAVGGGSVIDTAKVANLLSVARDADIFDFVNQPMGKGQEPPPNLHPLIALPTTAGTGSETTGVAVFDYTAMNSKTGIGHKSLRPDLGMIDPHSVATMPSRVTAWSGFDVLCHALESFTAIPYTERPVGPTPSYIRPAYQGSNPISDVWSLHALRMTAKYLRRAVADPGDTEARSEMMLASMMAGVGFGNAGVHLCHGLSYPLASLNKTYQAAEYPTDHPMLPHGLSVIMTAPAVFKYTASACPERHLQAAEILGADISNAKLSDAGDILAEELRKFMHDLGVPNGIREFGFSASDAADLVQAAMPNKRVLMLAPHPLVEEHLASIYENSVTVF
ncbi:probable hydroxyacid-oxoacid transhydrogenase, mitochondrial [Sycon ciliatum]|uniref:probable hydroxyacid-oxoacid transhydrogenase, mitochondrial n=1 Tax=Sycon ciliatum TaxID=27933 RepID=UPI0031F6D6CA